MMNKAYLKADYEATKNLVDLTIRQRELLEAWLYAGQTMGQLALRYGISRENRQDGLLDPSPAHTDILKIRLPKLTPYQTLRR